VKKASQAGGAPRYLYGALLTLIAVTPIPGASAAGFEPVGKMTEGRLGARATLLSDGSVLVTGGSTLRNRSIVALGSAERFDPKTGQFTPVGPMAERRNESHAAVRLPDGRALVVGGTFTQTAELFDPKTGQFSVTGKMLRMRGGVTATLLSDGRALIAGGWEQKLSPYTAELYDPATGQFASAGPMATWRYWHAAVRLADGRVLVAGGYDLKNQASRSIEIYDPGTNTFSVKAEMVEARVFPTAALLPDGRVLIAGGSYTDVAGNDVGVRNSIELFDPATGRSVIADGLTVPRLANIMVPLPDGRILVAGGQVDNRLPNGLLKSSILSTAEFLEPTSGRNSPAPPMSVGRAFPAAALLLDGRVLVLGGATWGDQLVATDTAEVFVP
jgi:hypothetical protein